MAVFKSAFGSALEEAFAGVSNGVAPTDGAAYIASIYDGTKDVDGKEALATNTGALFIDNVSGSGTITFYTHENVYSDGVLLATYDTTAGYSELLINSNVANNDSVSWVMSGVTQFDKSQGVMG